MLMAGGIASVFSASTREGATILEITPKAVRRRRRERLFLWTLTWFAFALLLGVPVLFHLIGVPDSQDLPRVYVAVSLPAAVLALGNWFHTRRTILAVNRVAVCERGLYPPFKPKQRFSRDDWFVPYKDVVAMEPVAERE